MKYHYIYKITCLCGSLAGHYYIGKHSTENLEKDYYYGSGKIIKGYYKKYGKTKNITFVKEILEFNDTAENNSQREKEIIGDLYKTDTNCLNLKYGGEGGGWEKGMTAINKGKKATQQQRLHLSEAMSKPILQYDKEGNFIKEWNSEKEIDSYFGGKSVSKAIVGKKKTAYGFIWKYKYDNNKIKPFKDDRFTHILQFTKNGEFVKKWDTIAEAANNYSVSVSAIFNALNHRNRCKSSAGYIWKYA